MRRFIDFLRGRDAMRAKETTAARLEDRGRQNDSRGVGMYRPRQHFDFAQFRMLTTRANKPQAEPQALSRVILLQPIVPLELTQLYTKSNLDSHSSSDISLTLWFSISAQYSRIHVRTTYTYEK